MPVLIFFCVHPTYADEGAQKNDTCIADTPTYIVDSLAINVHFPQGESRIDTTYRDNPTAFAGLRTVLARTMAGGMFRSVEIQSWASPEGASDLNEQLVRGRTANLTRWILNHTQVPADKIYPTGGGVAWQQLRDVVSASEAPYRGEVVRIIDETPLWVYDNRGRVVSGRKKRLEELGAGTVWQDMLARFFPSIRSSCAVVVHLAKPKPDTAALAADSLAREAARVAAAEQQRVADSLATAAAQLRVADSLAALAARQKAAQVRKQTFPLALKTNALMDVAQVPNLGVEASLGKGWTVGLNGMFAWWDISRKDYFWRIYGGDLNARKYMGRKAARRNFSGHHVGLYAQAVSYDFALGGKGIIVGIPGGGFMEMWNYGGGLEYGYSAPIARRLNLDFTLGLGYLGGKYREYRPMDDCYVWLTTKKRQWFGPTKAEVSLVWLLGKEKEGGAR